MINKDSKFLIVGLGLIGGSYAIKLKSLGYKVYAIDINIDAINYALDNNYIDATNIKEKELIIVFLFKYFLFSFIHLMLSNGYKHKTI